MIFYLITNRQGSPVTCATTKQKAIHEAQSYGLKTNEYDIAKMSIDITSETICKLLANQGGYIKSITYVLQKEKSK